MRVGAINVLWAPVLRPVSLRNPGLLWPLLLSCIGWLGLVCLGATDSLALCLSPGVGALSSAIDAAFFYARPAALALEWAAMVAAMMGPLVLVSFAALATRTAPARREHVVGSALASYMLVWVLLGLALVPGILILRSVIAALGAGTPGLVFAAYAPAVSWAGTKFRQNRLPALHRTPLFHATDQVPQAAKFGASFGIRCAVSCLPLMLAPMIAGQGIIGMVLMTHILLSERTAPRPKQLPMRRALLVMAAFALIQSALIPV